MENRKIGSWSLRFERVAIFNGKHGMTVGLPLEIEDLIRLVKHVNAHRKRSDPPTAEVIEALFAGYPRLEEMILEVALGPNQLGG